MRKLPLHRLDSTNDTQTPTKAVTSLNSLRVKHEQCIWPISGDATKLTLELPQATAAPMHIGVAMNNSTRTTATTNKTTAGRSLNSQACDSVN